MTLPEFASELTIAMSEEELQEFEPSSVDVAHKTLGRYELVYELGVGGMANVYLARAAGPAGFQKWFAIKRIHRHLAKDRRFVEMFLDEARISASLQHPNVAPVFDLGEQSGEYFLAMEYLHGEHLGSLGVRAAREMGRVPPPLAAYAVARAADGLHHAHEAKDRDGSPLKLVHRDVSPQNIFVTYDGTVRITDFGIAKAANRITQTETGSTKGKLAYMSPEHALNQPIDRRSDVFALGVVLWELTVGRRLFKAENDAATLMRITSGRTLHPSQVVPDYPKELEKIVMRALAHDSSQRYPTAAAFARDLDRFVANAGSPAGAAELSGLMQQLFGDRITAKETLLRSDRVSDVRASLALAKAEETSGSGALPREQSHSSVVTRTPSPGQLPSDRRWPVLILAGLGLAVAGVVAAVALTSDDQSSIRVTSSPSGATVRVDDVLVGSTPVTVDRLQTGRHSIELELSGYEPFEASFDAERGRTELSYRLLPTEEGEPSTAPVEAPAPPRNDLPTGVDPPGGAAAQPPVAQPPVAEPEVVEPEVVEPEVVEPEAPDPPPVAAARPARRTARVRRPPPPPAYLNLVTVPWAEVRINGRAAGRTPLVRRQVPSGRVSIQLRPEGSGRWRTIRIQADPGDTVSRRIEL